MPARARSLPSPSLTPRARQIYRRLVRHLAAGRASITYGELANALRPPLHPRSRHLYAALTELARACRARGLPILPAIVWRAGVHHPADGYFAAAHPRARGLPGQLAAWQQEHARVIAHPPAAWPESP